MIQRGKGLRAIWLGGRVEENHRGGVGRTGRRRKWWEGERVGDRRVFGRFGKRQRGSDGRWREERSEKGAKWKSRVEEVGVSRGSWERYDRGKS